MSLRLSHTMNSAALRGRAGIVCTGMTQSASQPGQTAVAAGRARTRSRCALRAPTASAGHWRSSDSLIRTARGTVFEGPFVDGKSNGRFVTRWADGSTRTETYIAGEIQ